MMVKVIDLECTALLVKFCVEAAKQKFTNFHVVQQN